MYACLYVFKSLSSHLNDVHHSTVAGSQPRNVRMLQEIFDIGDGQLEAVEGEEGGEVGRVEGGDDHDEEPPRREENAGGV